MLNDAAKIEAATVTAATFKAKPAKKAAPAKATPAKATPAKVAASQDDLNAAAIAVETVTIGRALNSSLEAIAHAQKEAHAHALKLKQTLLSGGNKVKGENGRYLPHVAAFLAEVFRGDQRKPRTIDVAKTRLIQVIVSTTEERLGRDKSHDTPKNTRAPQHKGGAGQEPIDENGEVTGGNGAEPSKSAERRDAIKASVQVIGERVLAIARIAGEAPKSTRDKINTELANIRELLKTIKANNA